MSKYSYYEKSFKKDKEIWVKLIIASYTAFFNLDCIFFKVVIYFDPRHCLLSWLRHWRNILVKTSRNYCSIFYFRYVVFKFVKQVVPREINMLFIVGLTSHRTKHRPPLSRQKETFCIRKYCCCIFIKIKIDIVHRRWHH